MKSGVHLASRVGESQIYLRRNEMYVHTRLFSVCYGNEVSSSATSDIDSYNWEFTKFTFSVLRLYSVDYASIDVIRLVSK
jgi:hypothetical protein